MRPEGSIIRYSNIALIENLPIPNLKPISNNTPIAQNYQSILSWILLHLMVLGQQVYKNYNQMNAFQTF